MAEEEEPPPSPPLQVPQPPAPPAAAPPAAPVFNHSRGKAAEYLLVFRPGPVTSNSIASKDRRRLKVRACAGP